MDTITCEKPPAKSTAIIGEYLIHQLHDLGVRHIFGVPGDYVLAFDEQVTKSNVNFINMSDEQGAGFAADGYARIAGLGVVAVTYGVGGLKVVNPTAEAYAEKSPVVVISGAPGMRERQKTPLLHHMVRNFDTQSKIFDQVTVASTVLDNPRRAFEEIRRVLDAAMRYKRPVYIELPRDIAVMQGIDGNGRRAPEAPVPEPPVLKEALAEALSLINRAVRPVILAGEEIQRFGLKDTLLRLVNRSNIPVAATMLSKTVLGECHPAYLGVYCGAVGDERVREYVEASDCLIILGAFMSDMMLGLNTARIDQGRTIYVTSESCAVRYHSYEGIGLDAFLGGLLSADLQARKIRRIPHPEQPEEFAAVPERKVTAGRLFQRLNQFLTDEVVIVADTGDSLFGSLDLFVHCGSEYLASSYYTSMGFAVPAAIGAQLANPQLRPLVLVGDGAFQMTGMELSAAVRYNLNPIVVVLNNKGYATERGILDGPFNDLVNWDFSKVPDVLGAGKGFAVETEEQLVRALAAARRNRQSFSILDVRLDQDDVSPALERIAAGLAKRVRGTA